jgi:hypothetical protein
MRHSLFTRPSAFLPLAMSLAALGLVIGYASMYGTARQADEGTPAHLFQLLMAAQLPLIGYFAIRWLPEAPRQAAAVLATQSAAIAAAFFPVWYFNW